MPALGPHGKADKAMDIDLKALSSANDAPSSAAPAPAQDTDFAEPPNPWAPVQPTPTSAAGAAPAATLSKPSRAGGNPFAAMQSQWATRASVSAAQPSGPAASQGAAAEISQSMQAVASPSSVGAQSNAAAPSAPAQQQCFTNTEGVKVCYMNDSNGKNTTDIHKEGGVNDYHNSQNSDQKIGIQGHIPGNNVTDTLNHLGSNPPPNEHKDGNTAFQGKANADIKYQHDIHKDNSTFTDHQNGDLNANQEYKAAHKGSDGSKEMSEIDEDREEHKASDTKVDAKGKDTATVDDWKESDDHRFMSDKPGTKDDSTLVWDVDKSGKQQKQEFQGKGVYDLHEESSKHDSVKAKVDGDQGWGAFEQDMKDFDTVFDMDAAWKERMKHLGTAGQKRQSVDDVDGSEGLDRRQLGGGWGEHVNCWSHPHGEGCGWIGHDRRGVEEDAAVEADSLVSPKHFRTKCCGKYPGSVYGCIDCIQDMREAERYRAYSRDVRPADEIPPPDPLPEHSYECCDWPRDAKVPCSCFYKQVERNKLKKEREEYSDETEKRDVGAAEIYHPHSSLPLPLGWKSHECCPNPRDSKHACKCPQDAIAHRLAPIIIPSLVQPGWTPVDAEGHAVAKRDVGAGEVASSASQQNSQIGLFLLAVALGVMLTLFLGKKVPQWVRRRKAKKASQYEPGMSTIESAPYVDLPVGRDGA